MLEDITIWCKRAFLNNFWFERHLTSEEWEAINSGDIPKMLDIVREAVSASHTSIISYLVAKDGVKQYCRDHILDINPTTEYVKAILTEEVKAGPFSSRTVHEYAAYQQDVRGGRWAVVTNAVENGEFGAAMLMLQIPGFPDVFPRDKTHLMYMIFKTISQGKAALEDGKRICKIFLDAGLDINDYRFYGSGAIASSSLNTAIKLENQALFNFLLEEGVDVRFEDAEKGYSGMTPSPLHLAVSKGLVWAVKALLDAGSALIEDEADNTVFHAAFNYITGNTSQILELLFAEAVKLPQDNFTPILHNVFYAALSKSKLQQEHLEVLFRYYPDLYTESQTVSSGSKNITMMRKDYKGGWTKYGGAMTFEGDYVHITCFSRDSLHPLDTAIKHDNVAAVAFFLEKGFCDVGSEFFISSSEEGAMHYNMPLHASAEAHSLKVVELLLSQGADMRLVYNSRYPIESALRHVNTDRDGSKAIQIIKSFEGKGYDIGTESNESGKTLLMSLGASGGFYSPKATGYIFKKSHLNAQDKKGATALHHASYGAEECLMFLLATSGANFDLVDCQGQTPLHYAPSGWCDEYKPIYIITLLALGGSLSQKDINGKSTLDILVLDDSCLPYIDLFKKCEKVFSAIKPEKGFVSVLGLFDCRTLFYRESDSLDISKVETRLDAIEQAFNGDHLTGNVMYFYGLDWG